MKLCFSNFWNCLADAAENALNCEKDLHKVILKKVVIVIALLCFSGVDATIIFQHGCEVSRDVSHKFQYRDKALLCAFLNVLY